MVISATGSVEGIYALYMLKKVEIWTGDIDDRQTLKDRATQLLRSKSGALVTQYNMNTEWA